VTSGHLRDLDRNGAMFWPDVIVDSRPVSHPEEALAIGSTTLPFFFATNSLNQMATLNDHDVVLAKEYAFINEPIFNQLPDVVETVDHASSLFLQFRAYGF
jgi:hypothetical protein